MQKKEEPPTEVGVIVGRFQSPYLHEAHVELIKSVCATHEKVIIFLGLSPLKGTFNHPLDFESRKQMITREFPDVIVVYIKDVPCDALWSQNLDRQIRDLVAPRQKVTLYGSRDSFIPYYSGEFKTQELVSSRIISATSIRQKAASKVIDSPKFRAGVVWGVANRYPTVFTTVDICIFNEDKTQVLLGKKPNEAKYRFIGGFSDVNSESFEEDARREVYEEVQIELSDLTYRGSALIDDWRFRKECDKIKTLFFTGIYSYGKVTPSDDIAEAKWFSLDELKNGDVIVDEHKTLLKFL